MFPESLFVIAVNEAKRENIHKNKHTHRKSQVRILCGNQNDMFEDWQTTEVSKANVRFRKQDKNSYMIIATQNLCTNKEHLEGTEEMKIAVFQWQTNG